MLQGIEVCEEERKYVWIDSASLAKSQRLIVILSVTRPVLTWRGDNEGQYREDL